MLIDYLFLEYLPTMLAIWEAEFLLQRNCVMEQSKIHYITEAATLLSFRNYYLNS